jgi:predicted dinucleotide-binding enzyme
VVVLCTKGAANADALRAAGLETLAGKVLIDTTNPLDEGAGFPPKLLVGHTDSGGEQVQRLAAKAHVVKAWNTVGNALMFRPELPGGPPDMFICGNDDGAKKTVTAILNDFGWPALDLGKIEASRVLEPMCIAWVLFGARTNTWTHAFKLLRR